jgi:hypothetical protein
LVLDFFDIIAPIQLIVDASPVGLGAVMVQFKPEGPRVVTYISRALTDVEKRYSQAEKEALGIVWVCEKLHLYLYGEHETHPPNEGRVENNVERCGRLVHILP